MLVASIDPVPLALHEPSVYPVVDYPELEPEVAYLDVFVCLFEYGPESSGTALFAQRGRPAVLSPNDFSPVRLRRGLLGQSGTQSFFTEAGRPFSLYAVLGSHVHRASLVPKVNALIASLTVNSTTTDVPASRPQWN